jgi:hypothetical protein
MKATVQRHAGSCLATGYLYWGVPAFCFCVLRICDCASRYQLFGGHPMVWYIGRYEICDTRFL